MTKKLSRLLIAASLGVLAAPATAGGANADPNGFAAGAGADPGGLTGGAGWEPGGLTWWSGFWALFLG